MTTATTGAPASAQWALWSTYAFLAVDRPEQLSAARMIADDVLGRVELACSRFRADSELVRVNSRAGRWTEASPLLVAAVTAAIRGAELSGGLVDPCLGHALVSLGYDTDIDLVRRRRTESWPVLGTTASAGAWRRVEVRECAVLVPEGVALDLGATAKAWAADLVADTVAATLHCRVAVSLGGDVSVDGPSDGGVPTWPVRVTETPQGGGTLVEVTGGLATSSTLTRRWRGPRGVVVHHVLDPRTGTPAREVFRTVTALGGDALRANVASTAALVLGHDAPGWLAHRGVSARLVDADGRVTAVGGWPPDPSTREDR